MLFHLVSPRLNCYGTDQGQPCILCYWCNQDIGLSLPLLGYHHILGNHLCQGFLAFHSSSIMGFLMIVDDSDPGS
uniref:Uncharacterized protein n=1 Tax=Arundo donax TaxID=35708 RepID=A0A0A9BQP5_ARUDO